MKSLQSFPSGYCVILIPMSIDTTVSKDHSTVCTSVELQSQLCGDVHTMSSVLPVQEDEFLKTGGKRSAQGRRGCQNLQPWKNMG